jgi:hypothetical protein
MGCMLIVKLFPTEREDTTLEDVDAGISHVGKPGIPVLSLVGCKKIRLFGVMAEVFTV